MLQIGQLLVSHVDCLRSRFTTTDADMAEIPSGTLRVGIIGAASIAKKAVNAAKFTEGRVGKQHRVTCVYCVNLCVMHVMS